MQINLSHFEVAVLFALLASVILGLVTKRNDRDRVSYGLYCFGYFIAALFGIGWFMRILHG
jgi:uncharacterized membrane protein